MLQAAVATFLQGSLAMATDVTMPRLLVEVGGEVRRGAPLVEIETDKANMTYEADTHGTLIEVVAQEGDSFSSAR
jgi:pyruvate/2-oxoglutarate dehydrogenase complex dihydrolipoamide acyltransferase (E2) component